MKKYLTALPAYFRRHNFKRLHKSIEELNSNDIKMLSEKAFLTEDSSLEDCLCGLEAIHADIGDACHILRALSTKPGTTDAENVVYSIDDPEEIELLPYGFPSNGVISVDYFNSANSSRAAFISWLTGQTSSIELDLLDY